MNAGPVVERSRIDRRGEGILADWERDSTRMAVALRTAAKMLLDARERAYAQERRIRDAAKRQGHDIDTRADYASGSGAAYSIACSIIAGALRVARIEEIAGDFVPNQEPARPELPSEITDPERVIELPDATLAMRADEIEREIAVDDAVLAHTGDTTKEG